MDVGMTAGGNVGGDVVVGVDIGGTKTSAARVDGAAGAGQVHTAATPALAGPAAVLAVVADLVGRCRQQDSTARLVGVGVGTAGVVDVGAGSIVAANETFPGWPGTPVRDLLQDQLGVPVHVENDVDAHAAGEAWVGAAAGAASALVVAVGTGVGSALVLDGTCLRGTRGASGEMGHTPSALAAGLRCFCGRPGHLEAVAAGPAVVQQYRAGGGDPAAVTTADVFERLAAGDALAQKVVARAAGALGQAVAGLVTFLDPEVVVVGGGVAQSRGPWWQTFEDTLRAELIPPFADLPVRRSELGGLAPLLGAARGAWRLLERDLSA